MLGKTFCLSKNYIHKHGLNTPQLDQSIDQSLEEVRNISKDLYPNQLNQYGLGTAVEALCDKVRESTNVFVSSDIQLPEDQMVSKEIKKSTFIASSRSVFPTLSSMQLRPPSVLRVR